MSDQKLWTCNPCLCIAIWLLSRLLTSCAPGLSLYGEFMDYLPLLVHICTHLFKWIIFNCVYSQDNVYFTLRLKISINFKGFGHWRFQMIQYHTILDIIYFQFLFFWSRKNNKTNYKLLLIKYSKNQFLKPPANIWSSLFHS